MLKIEKIDAARYRITDGEDSFEFPKEKFEDLYYAVPTHPTQFYRLLTEEIVASIEERKLMNKMIGPSGANREKVLTELQEQIRTLPAP